jgi:hypothetical protein
MTLSFLCLPQDPFNKETKLHSEMANVSRAWPSVRRTSRVSLLELRSRSSSSKMDALGRRSKMMAAATTEQGYTKEVDL